MRYIFFWGLFITISVKSQNLIPNHSFENFKSVNLFYLDSSLYDWESNIGSPDFFSKSRPESIWEGDSSEPFVVATGVPGNFSGNQGAKDGESYLGIDNSPGNFEGVRVNLNKPLTVGAEYELSFFCSLADMSTHKIDSLNFGFLGKGNSESKYLIKLIGGGKKKGWKKVSFRFKAEIDADKFYLGGRVADLKKIKLLKD